MDYPDFISMISLIIGFVIMIIVCSCVFYRRNRQQGRILNAPVVVTSSTHTAPGGYPVTQITATSAYPTNVYAAPYPMQTGCPAQMPMPVPMPMPETHPPAMPQPCLAPYQPMPVSNMNPPTYDMAVGGSNRTHNQAFNPMYEKQAPYNPGYGN